MTDAETINVDLASISASPFNHRKKFTGIDELAVSIKEHGLISPVTVRPHPKAAGRAGMYELVVGERRWRAAKKAGLLTISAIVRELTDKQVLEIQLIENVQRVDVHPLEEADGYEELLEKHGYDVDGIAKKTGKSTSYIYARLKLGALAAYPRKAFLEDRLSASLALLIARIPDVDLQEKATREVLGEREAIMAAEEDSAVNGEDPLAVERRQVDVTDSEDEQRIVEELPMSVREAQIHLRRRYMLRLELATFDLADQQLVPKAGACTVCSYRTGNQRELFAEVSSADVCTNPPCFEAKTTAAFAVKAAAAKAQGTKIIARDKTERMFSPIDGRTVAGNSPYVDPKAAVPSDLVPMGTKAPTWEKLLGKKIEPPKVLVQDQTGAARELIDKAAAVKLLREAGKIDKPVKPTSSSGMSPNEWKKRDDAERRKREIRERALEQITRSAFQKLTGPVDEKKELAQWKWIVRTIVMRDVPELAQELLGVKEPEDLLRLVESPGSARQILFSCLFAELADSSYRDPDKYGELLAGVKLLGLDYDDAVEDAKAALRAAEQVEKKLDDKKAAKKGGKKS